MDEANTPVSNGHTDGTKYEAIVAAAAQLFAERGFSGTSLKDIADAVGVLKGSLYHYIDSKDDLLFEVIKVPYVGIRENMAHSDHFASDPVRQLAAFSFCHVALNAVSGRLNGAIVMMNESRSLSEDKHASIAQDRHGYDRYLRSILLRGMQTGVFDPAIDVRVNAFSIFGVLTSYMRWYRPERELAPSQIARESAAFVLASMLKPEHRDSDRYAVVDEVVGALTKVHGIEFTR